MQVRAGFHLKIAELAGNQLLVEFLERILPRTAMIATFYRYPPRQPAAAHDHEHLLKLLIAGDADGCVSFMEQHLDIDEKKLQIPEKPAIRNIDLASVFQATDDGNEAGAKAEPA